MLERDRELERLRDRLDVAGGGEGGVVVVEGAAGIGKTSLLRAVAREAQERDFEVARARGAELEREWPFGIVRQLLEPALRRATAAERERLLEGAAGLAAHVLLPELAAGADAVDASFGTLHGLYWLCANLAARRPLLLAVDDAQWADQASLRFLGVLARRLDALPALIVLAQRPAALAADSQTERVTLRPLSPDAVRALLDGADAEFAAACHAATGGNPFLLTRLARGLREQGVPFTAGHRDRVRGAGAEAVRDAVTATLARLDPSAVALAEATAVLGDDAGLALAAELTGGGDAEGAAEAVAALVEAGVLEDGRPLRFVHAIVRDAVAARPACRALHLRAAELLAARHAAPDAIAAHLLAADPGGRAWVVERLLTAARQALAQGEPAVALGRLERALAEPPSSPAVRAELLLDLARAKGELGRPDALDQLRAAYALAPDPARRARAALELLWVGGPTLDVAELIALLERALGDAGDDRELTLELEAARLAAVDTSHARLAESWAAGELQRWAELEGRTPAERLLLAQLALGQMHAGGPADAAAAFALRAAGEPGFEPTGRGPASATRAAGERAFEPTGRGGMALMFALRVLYKADRLDAAEHVLERQLRAARRRGSIGAFALLSTFRGAIAMRRGALGAAEADLRSALDAVPPDAWRRRQVVAGLIDVLAETGAVDEAQALLAGGDWDAELPADPASTVLLATRSRLRLAQGDPQRALADALGAHSRVAGESLNWDGRARIARLHHALGDTTRAREEAGACLVAARRWGTPAAIGQALCTSGLIEGELELLREGVEQLERSPARLELANALVDHGAALRRAGQRAAAREPLRRGLDIAAAGGARPLAERARAELTATGVRVRRDAQTGAAALTPSERRIAELAAAGESNVQIAQSLFVTVKTVEMHLSSAYRKLDVGSRRELPQVPGLNPGSPP